MVSKGVGNRGQSCQVFATARERQKQLAATKPPSGAVGALRATFREQPITGAPDLAQHLVESSRKAAGGLE